MREATDGVPHSRRRVLLLGAFFAAMLVGGKVALQKKDRSLSPEYLGRDLGNFRVVFGDAVLKERFRPFLSNVFHLFPEPELMELVSGLVREDARDPVVFQHLTRELDSISPALAGPRFALPALSKQKRVMAEQTSRLLGTRLKIDGYLEIGSHGRYLDALEDRLSLTGPVFTSAPRPPSYSVEDVVDRGQLTKVGNVLPWSDYEPLAPSEIPDSSLDLVTVYIGLHHARVEQRVPYIRSLARVLRRGGRLILRDHNVENAEQEHIVSLAHDIFNAGTRETWATNAAERRNFYPLGTIIQLLAEAGLRPGFERLLQDGDPTLNTLLHFEKA